MPVSWALLLKVLCVCVCACVQQPHDDHITGGHTRTLYLFRIGVQVS